MSIPRRLLNIARRKLDSLADNVGEWTPSTSRPGGVNDARRELDDFLKTTRTSSPPPTPNAPHVLAKEFALLGIDPTRDLPAIQAAWRRCARENHPDRFPNDPAARAAAQERFLRGQEAYEAIMVWVKS